MKTKQKPTARQWKKGETRPCPTKKCGHHHISGTGPCIEVGCGCHGAYGKKER